MADIPESELQYYEDIQAIQDSALLKMRLAWEKFKEKVLKEEEDGHLALYVALLLAFHAIARDALAKGVVVGNNYFEDQFSITGLTKEQQKKYITKHLNKFDELAKELFQKDVRDKLQNTLDTEREKVLNSYNKYLPGYANVAAFIAYSVFARNIVLLNRTLGRRGLSDNTVKVKWVLGITDKHSKDCLRLSLGDQGEAPGVWKIQDLVSKDLLPRSPSLDCSGNCLCHLSPVV